ncbi:filamentous hemagglutinin family protein [Novosphingobium hassiacum]|uniref:Filamentous hemagglutinin family protein n=1 Tax=Novosphingobium hassiacum TaxID=173676 RepID=A0A7W5ZV85_9SPHN|nr:hypothetical protein [Novosphingobium hassiacum]MBB3860588.1 filamentous hemagglutinin family protein [Novosphingobium hassiacum]
MTEATMHRQVTISRSGHIIATEAWLRKPVRHEVVRAQPRHKSAMSRLLAGVSAGAAALAFLAGPTHVRAQAVIGTPTIQFGIENVDRTVPGTDTVNVSAPEALLDWTSTSASGVFLPEGSTLRFSRDGDYTVLNRVTSAVSGGPLSISGLVQSDSGGKVWFYNPGGWVVGANGVFNVGSLVLTSLPITVDSATDTVSRLFGDKGEIRFGAATVPTSSVTISNQARINADLATGSYVALVAPKVSQGGTVRVDGSAAYVAAEAATMTINNGLFDIVVDSGSSDTTGISHTGTTGGPAGSLSDPNHRIYLVAVPKNQAMTAVVAGSLGYDAAVSASSETDGSIVLSAGRNVLGGSIDLDSAVGTNASLLVQGLNASNVVNGAASGGIGIDATAADVTFGADAFLKAQGDIKVDASGGNDLTVGGALDLRTSNAVTSGAITVNVGSGSAFVVDGDFTASTVAEGLIQVDPDNGDVLLADSVGSDAASGDVHVIVRDADFSVGGEMTLQSIATGGVGALSAGKATAGSVLFSALQDQPTSPTRQIDLGPVQLTSNAGTAGFSAPQLPVAGSASQSGAVEFSVDGGFLSASNINLSTSAQASLGVNSAPQQATTGKIGFSFANSDSEGFSTGSLNANSYAFAESGGLVTQGDVGLSLDNADLVSGGGIYGYIGLRSSAYGTLTLPNTVRVSLTNGSTLDLGDGYLSLEASGGNGIGIQKSANIAISLDDSTLTGSSVYAYSSARGTGTGASALAGNMSLSVVNGGALDVANSVYLNTDGYGGNGADAGNGTGGNIDVVIDDGAIGTGYFSASSTGTAGFRDSGSGLTGTGRGGTTTIVQRGANSSVTVDTFIAESLGFGSRGGEGKSFNSQASSGAGGGAGIGGTATYSIESGNLTATDLSVRADGEGGEGRSVEGFSPAKGGEGGGGTASFTQSGGTATINTLRVSASGVGGNGAQFDSYLGIDGGNGGDGFGGSASVGLTGGTLYSDTLSVEANGNKSIDYGNGYVAYFGNGGDLFYDNGSAGNGGTGRGGDALLSVNGGSLLDAADSNAVSLAVTINAIGEGGAGGAAYIESDEIANSGSGGAGFGGNATASFASGAFDATRLDINANGRGGLAGNDAQRISSDANRAGAGGSGTGGSAAFEIGTAFDSLTSSDNDRITTIIANGIGQAGESGRIGGAGGAGTGGSATIRAVGGITDLVAPQVSATGTGGAGGNGNLDGNGGAGGNGTGGSANIVADGVGTRLSLSNQALSARGQAGSGGEGGSGSTQLDAAGNGGAGGVGSGGTISYLASNLARLGVPGQTNPENHDVGGFGGDGGLAGNATVFEQNAVGNGGAGGAAVGGNFIGRAESGGDLTFGAVTIAADGFGGDGGRLGNVSSVQTGPSIGGIGGDGTGGSVSLTTAGIGSSLTVSALTVTANGSGGDGASSVGNNLATGDGSIGSAGGSGVGGAITIQADDEALLTLAPDAVRIDLMANGMGGSGGRGSAALAGSGGDGGAGGVGGLGQGGGIALAANASGEAEIAAAGTTFIMANGFGGSGGRGGNGASTTAPNTLGGNGGDAGITAPGVGGTVAFNAIGGALTVGTLDVAARGFTQITTGPGSPGNGPAGFGAQGQRNFALPFGGDVSFTSGDDEGGDTGRMQIGAASIDVTSQIVFDGFAFGGAGGKVDLLAQSSQASGAMRFSRLAINATGIPVEGSNVTVTAVSGPIEVDSDLLVQAAGFVSVTTNGSAGVLVGGLADISAPLGLTITGNNGGQLSADTINLISSGSIDIASVDCPNETCAPVHATSQLRALAEGDFNLTGPAFIAGLGSVDIYASGTISGERGSGYFSNGDVLVRGAGDVTVRNATGGQINVAAGAVEDGEIFYQPATLTLGEVEGGGLFDSAHGANFVSGGGITVTDGNTISARAELTFFSGNDIAVGAGNLIEANTDQTFEPSSISFRAGAVDIAYTLAIGDIATVSFGSGTTVNSNSGAIDLSGAAIDARFATFFANQLRADVTGQLALTDPRGDDGGRLDPACLEGAICIGSATTSGNILIGKGGISPLDVLATGSLSGRNVGISALGRIALDPAAQVLAVNSVNIASAQGDIALGAGALVRGGTVALSGAGSLTGSGAIEATFDDVGLTFGGDIDAASISAARELTTASLVGGVTEGSFRAPGSLRVGQLTLGTDADIGARDDLVIGSIALGGKSALLTAGGLLDLSATQNVLNLDLSAPTVTFGALNVAGDVSIEGGSVSGMAAVAGGTLTVDADDLSAQQLQSAGDLSLTVVNTAALGTVASTGGSVTIDPALLTFDAITAADAVNLAGGTITGGTASAGTGLDITATGALTLTSASSGSTMTINAASMRSGALVAGTDLSLTVANAVILTDAARAGANLSVSSASLVAPSLSAVGNLSVTAPGAATLGTATAGQALTIDAGDLRFDALNGNTIGVKAGSVLGGSVRSTGSSNIAATGPLSVASVDAGMAIALAGSSVAANALTAGAGVSVTSAGAARFGTASGSAINVTTGSLTFDTITSRGISSITTTGNVAGGTITSVGALAVSSGGSVGFTKLDGGSVSVAARSVAGGDVTARNGAIRISASGPVTTGALSATGNIGLDAGALTFTTASAGGRFDANVSSLSSGAITAAGDVSIFSGEDLTLGSLTGAAVSLGSSGVVNVAALVASGLVSVSADAVSLTSPGALQISTINASNGNIEVIANGSILGQTINARGDVLLRSITSDVTVTRVSAGYASASSDSLRPQATAVSGVIGQGDIRIEAARDIRIDSVADAANAFIANAGRTIILNGLATGKTMALSSTDLGIGTTGQLGEAAHTTSIELINSGQGVTYLGDNARTDASGGYTVSQGEFSRIQSGGDLLVQGGSAIRVGDLSVVAQAGTTPGQIGQTGRLALAAQGPITFVGGVTMSNAAGNTLAVNSGQAIALDATTGSIRLLEGQARAGTLSLSGGSVAMVTAQASADIANVTDTAPITERLSKNDGVTADRTLVEAETISLRSDRKVYIQNTSASTEFADRRGLVATNLSIDSRDGGTLDVVINGTVGGATGIDAIGVIGFNEDLTALSSVNGCVVANVEACGVDPVEEPIIEEPFSAINTRDVIEEVLDEAPEDSALVVIDSFMQSPLIQLNQIAPAGFEPLIDEPVTGTGNDDMLGEEQPGE